MASDAKAFLDAIGVSSTSILGWSDGGIVGYHLASRHPGARREARRDRLEHPRRRHGSGDRRVDPLEVDAREPPRRSPAGRCQLSAPVADPGPRARLPPAARATSGCGTPTSRRTSCGRSRLPCSSSRATGTTSASSTCSSIRASLPAGPALRPAGGLPLRPPGEAPPPPPDRPRFPRRRTGGEDRARDVGAALPKAAPAEPRSVTLPITIDHNRMLVDVDFVRADGTLRTARAWVDTGNPTLVLGEALARDLGLDLASPEPGSAPAAQPRRPAPRACSPAACRSTSRA